MIIATKIIAVFLAILVISKTLYDFKRKQEVFSTFLFWTLAWILIVLVALLPEVFYNLTRNMAANNIGLGTFAGIAFVFLFFVTYRVYVKANRLERKLLEITTKLALEDIEDEN